jgi:formylglycine-generating enzyme required for sulfatase activity
MLKNLNISLLLIILFGWRAAANNLQLAGTKLLDSKHIQFTVSWENCWRLEGIEAPYNHDAIWIFAKYLKDGAEWHHLDINNCQIVKDSLKLEAELASDKKGIFIKPRKQIVGNIEPTEIIIELSSELQNGIYDLQVFGIEMVWVEEGVFYLGDGISYNGFSRGDKRTYLEIASEKEIRIGKDSLSLLDTGQYAPASDIPEYYPKGFKGFYCMKYEIGQEQYADFLNTLNYTRQKSRTYSSPSAAAGTLALSTGSGNRNGIIIEIPGISDNKAAIYTCNALRDNIFNNSNDGQNRACNVLNWADVAAYLDWAALRPMTEFEFEKICRGPLLPVQREFAWGTDKIVDANNIINDGTPEESVKENLLAGYGLASHGYNGPQGPIRAGFGGSDTSERLSIGAAYCGALELSGNLVENCVTVNQKGLQFDGRTGNGELNTNGDADVENWPGKDGEGAGYRGGGWLSGIQAEFRDLAISDRFYAGLKPNLRRTTSGGRGVRFK